MVCRSTAGRSSRLRERPAWADRDCYGLSGGPGWKRPDAPKSAGQLIEAAGLKGTRVGAAEVSPMHANYFVNTGGASAADVRGLIALARRTVQDRFGVALETEVKIVRPDGSFEPAA